MIDEKTKERRRKELNNKFRSWIWRGYLKAGTKIHLATSTRVKLPGGKKNIFNQKGFLIKSTHYGVVTCTGVDASGKNIYVEAKKELLINEGKEDEAKEFTVGSRPWGERISDDSAIIQHKGKLYLEFISDMEKDVVDEEDTPRVYYTYYEYGPETELEYKKLLQSDDLELVHFVKFDENGEGNFHLEDENGEKQTLKLPPKREQSKADVPIVCVAFENISVLIDEEYSKHMLYGSLDND